MNIFRLARTHTGRVFVSTTSRVTSDEPSRESVPLSSPISVLESSHKIQTPDPGSFQRGKAIPLLPWKQAGKPSARWGGGRTGAMTSDNGVINQTATDQSDKLQEAFNRRPASADASVVVSPSINEKTRTDWSLRRPRNLNPGRGSSEVTRDCVGTKTRPCALVRINVELSYWSVLFLFLRVEHGETDGERETQHKRVRLVHDSVT